MGRLATVQSGQTANTSTEGDPMRRLADIAFSQPAVPKLLVQPMKDHPEQDTTPVASIITVSMNHLQRLEAYLPSVMRSAGSFELIISDNGSADGSLDCIRTQYQDVIVLENGENLGFAEACNRGAMLARGDYLVFINPDTTVEPGWLLALLEPFDDPQVGLVTSKILLMESPDQINTCGNVIHISGIAQCRGLHQPRSEYGVLEEVDAVSGAAFAVRRSTFEALGGFDPDFFLYVEETDLSVRARLAGWKCIYQPASIVYHDYHLKFGPHKIFQQERNRYLTILKNFSWGTILALLPAFLLAEVVTWGFCMLTRDKNNLRNKIDAYLWILSNWSMIRAKHHAVQSLRRMRDRTIVSRCSYAINFRQVTHLHLAQVSEALFNTTFAVLKGLALAFIR